MEQLRLIAYMRVSKKIGMTVENQRPIIEKWISSQNVIITKWIIEEESTRNERPERDNAFKLLKSGEYNCLVCVRLDRWGRSTQEIIGSVKDLTDKGVRVVFINNQLDLNELTPFGKFTVTIFAAFAELERDLIQQRTLEGLERAKLQGKKLGRPAGARDKGKRRRSGYWLRWEKVKNG